MTRDELSCMIEEYLDDHTIGEFLDVVACRVADKEEELRKEVEK